MDRSLDEIVAADRPPRGPSNRSRPRRNQFPRDGVRKNTRDDRGNMDHDWVHDKYEDEDTSRSYRPRNRRRSPVEEDIEVSGAKLRVDNLHYDLSEADLEDLFTRIGPVTALQLRYDRAGRSNGVAFVTYERLSDARTAIREFDGANAKGQPIRLTLMTNAAPVRSRNPFDSVQKPKGSLFDRVENPRARDDRSLSPMSDVEMDRGGNRRRRGGPRTERRSDVSKPAPDNIDRYTPGQGGRSPRRRDDGRGGGRGGGRRPGARREERERDGQRTVQGRPRKTQEELDQEMEDYWKSNNATEPAATAAEGAAPAPATVAAPVDDVDMIE